MILCNEKSRAENWWVFLCVGVNNVSLTENSALKEL